MKTLIAVLSAAGVSFAAAYVLVSNNKDAQFQKERETLQANWQSELDKLNAALAAAEGRPVRIETVSVPSPAPVMTRPSPQEIIEKLLDLKPGSGEDRVQTVRQVVHQLESLAEYGQDSLPAIRNFLSRNQDIDYSTGDGREGGDRGAPSWMRGRSGTRMDFIIPPSLRLGLVDVLKQVGGESAQRILAELLETTGRAVEVAYVIRVLEEMAPGVYRETALAAAKDLLLNPLTIDNPTRLDENAKSYLYGVLSMFNDTSFASSAQSLLLNSEGRVDRSALNYLNESMKDQAVPTLLQAYNDTRVSNQWDRVSLAGQVLNYVGQNQQANLLLNEIVTNPDLDPRMRAFTVMRLAGGGDFGPMESPRPSDPAIIQSRMQVLEALKPGITDERILQAVDITARNLQNLAEGKPVENFRSGGRR